MARRTASAVAESTASTLAEDVQNGVATSGTPPKAKGEEGVVLIINDQLMS